MVYSMVKILEIYDSYTKGHSEHVAMLAEQIGKTLGLPVSDLQTLYWAGLVHDIGKILVPTSILNKPGKLTLDEYEMVKKHPVWGYQVLNTSEELQEIAFIIKHHHERWDGNGYPDRLSGVDIPLLSRILALVDTYDSMTSDRAYRTSLSPEDAKHIIARLSGNQFDPSLVETFLSLPSQ
ncbi:MAG: HD-GYP domain-containing protein [Thermotogaceae bacterium]|nr:HD-GYP domain-containing protein [Thermotogaceae bacterium]